MIKFPCNSQELYVQSEEFPADCRVLATKVEGFTQREVKRAKTARRFYQNLNMESHANIKAFIQGNIAKIVSISTEDMNLTEQIF